MFNEASKNEALDSQRLDKLKLSIHGLRREYGKMPIDRRITAFDPNVLTKVEAAYEGFETFSSVFSQILNMYTQPGSYRIANIQADATNQNGKKLWILLVNL